MLDGRRRCSPALGEGERLAVIGMGKLGGDELNYASDIDVMFVGEGDPTPLERRPAGSWRSPGRCFRVDANLRPQGRDGPLVRTVASYEAYWDRWAEPWEFQALAEGARRRRRPPSSAPGSTRRAADAPVDPRLQRRRPPLAAAPEGPGRSGAGPARA